jgi:hypothetical protein
MFVGPITPQTTTSFSGDTLAVGTHEKDDINFVSAPAIAGIDDILGLHLYEINPMNKGLIRYTLIVKR